METIFSNTGLFDALNAKAKEIQDFQEHDCVAIPFVIEESDSFMGVSMDFLGATVYLDVLKLASSVFAEGEIMVYDKLHAPSLPIDAVSRLRGIVYEWQFSVTKPVHSKIFRFRAVDYVAAVRQVIDAAIQAIKNGKTIVSDVKSLNLKSLEICRNQLSVECTLPSMNRLTVSTLKVDNFIFNPIDCAFNERFEIGFGDRNYVFWLEHWQNSYEGIRHEIEEIYYKGRVSISVDIDLEPRVITFDNENILDSITENSSGYLFDHKQFTKVCIQPLTRNVPVLCGYCDPKDCIREIYEGLLLMAKKHPLDGDDDEPPLLTAYNKIKSPIVEAYLKGTLPNDYIIDKRQQIIDSIITIDPDIEMIGVLQDGRVVDVDEDGLLSDDFVGKDGKQIKMPGLAEWLREIEPIIIDSEVGKPYSKDWADYLRRGLELMKQLRAQLADNIDLWYMAPFEDKSGTIRRPILIVG